MGNVCSGAGPTEDSAQSKKIDQELGLLRRALRQKQLLLLVGPGESGKSTLVKQLKIIYNNGYSKEEDRIVFRPTIYSNVLTSMNTLLRSLESDQVDRFTAEEKEGYDHLLNRLTLLDNDWKEQLSEKLTGYVRTLWKTTLVKEQFEYRNELAAEEDVHVTDSCKYFFDDIDRISIPGYVPTREDILHCRLRSTEVNEVTLMIGGYPITFIDVGGQRSQRRKWFDLFEKVNAIFFVAALSEFDQRAREDQTKNRMEDALAVFSFICQLPSFLSKDIILFLNKTDLFEDKVTRKKISVERFFPEFSEFPATGNVLQDGIDFFAQKFFDIARHRPKQIYLYPTTATSTHNIRLIFNALEKILLAEILNEIII